MVPNTDTILSVIVNYTAKCWGGVGLWLKMGQDRERSEEVGYC